MLVRFTLSIGYSNASHEEDVDIDDDDFLACETQEQKDRLLEEYWNDWSNNYIDGGFEVIEK